MDLYATDHRPAMTPIAGNPFQRNRVELVEADGIAACLIFRPGNRGLRRRSGRGSTDFGNVSRRVPGIEARIAITDVIETPGHSVQFREAAGSDQGRQAMLYAAKMAITAVDLLTNHEYLKQAKAVFEEDLRKTPRRERLRFGA